MFAGPVTCDVAGAALGFTAERVTLGRDGASVGIPFRAGWVLRRSDIKK